MKEIRLHGLGGQGVVTAAKLLAAAALHEGQYAVAIPAYGHERRGAPVFAYMRLDNQPIQIRSFVYGPDSVVVFDDSLPEYHGVDVTGGAKTGCLYVINSPSRPGFLAQDATGGCVDAMAVSTREIGRALPNSAMLGAFAAATGWVKLDSICHAIRYHFQGKAGEANVRAAVSAFESFSAFNRA